LPNRRKLVTKTLVISETKFVLGVVATWFVIALVLGLTGVFEAASAASIALTVWGLTAIELLIWWTFPQIKHWLGTVNLSLLIALHLTRFVGIYFIALCQSGELSCAFSVPAGAGDIVVAIGAAVMLFARAADRNWQKTIGLWNALGLVDILLVVLRAFRIGVIDWQGLAPLRALPLMILPTFLVPLIIVSHIVIFVRLSKRRNTERG
jgi:hypothetical protein